MSGVKGRSGGARPGTGGHRQGAGRKPNAWYWSQGKATPGGKPASADWLQEQAAQAKSATPSADANPHPKPLEDAEGLDMLQMLQAVALGKVEATTLQVRAAIAAVQYTHTKRHDGGRREEEADKAKKAAGGGKFAPSAPPRLVSNSGR